MPPRDQQAWRRAVSQGTSIAMQARAKRTRCWECNRSYGILLDSRTYRMMDETLDGKPYQMITTTECRWCEISFTLPTEYSAHSTSVGAHIARRMKGDDDGKTR